MKIRFCRTGPSMGVRKLSTELRTRGWNSRILHTFNSRWRQRNEDVVINWGNTHRIGVNGSSHNAANKLRCLQLLHANGIPVPEFTTDIGLAMEWCKDTDVCCRTSLHGSGGVDIVIASQPEDVVRAPLYTKYIKKQDEYRVHVFNNEVIDVQRKASRTGVEVVDWRVRNHANGFVFMREGVEVADDVAEMCKQAIIILGLTFGAIDLIYNAHYNKWWILEVNTAPGLEGQTIVSYADAIEKYIGERINA